MSGRGMVGRHSVPLDLLVFGLLNVNGTPPPKLGLLPPILVNPL